MIAEFRKNVENGSGLWNVNAKFEGLPRHKFATHEISREKKLVPMSIIALICSKILFEIAGLCNLH